MCGIAGIIDLTGKRQPDPAAVQRMARALIHRGPDDEGYLIRRGLGLASRRLSIVGLGDGHQPIFNEDGSVAVVFNGELFDYPERKAELEAKGHVFRTHTDTELIVHMYEEHGEGVFDRAQRASSPSPWSTSPRPRSISRATASASARCTGRSRATGCISAPRSRRWSPRAACRWRPTRAGSTTSSRSSPWARAAPCSKACSRCCPGTISRSPSAATAGARRSPSTATGTSTFPTPARRTIRADEPQAHRRVRGDVPPRRRDPAARRRAGGQLPERRRRLRPTCWRPPRSCAASRCRASPSRCRARARRDGRRARHRAPRRQPPDHPHVRQHAHRRHLRRAHRGRRLPGHRYVLRGAAGASPRRSTIRATRSR